jgi:hypothetical protein
MQRTRTFIYAVLALMLLSTAAFANQTEVKVVQSNETKIVLQVTFSEPQLNAVKTPRGEAFVVSADQAYPILSQGNPDVPRVAESVIIPDFGSMEISVINVDARIIENIEIAPSKGSISRDINPLDVPFVFGEAYQKNEFFPKSAASLDNPYILRDYRGQVVAFYPVQYNPVTKQLQVNKTIEVTLIHKNIAGENELIREKQPRINTTFDQLYRNRFLNYTQEAKYTPLNETGNLLIVAHSTYMEAMQPFISWKKQIGISTEIVEWSTIGTTAAQLQAYVQNYYQTNGLTFLLIVGDGQHIPSPVKTLSGTTPSPAYCDPAYGHLLGNDSYAEVIVGRFSAETVQQVQNHVQKTLLYESQPDVDATWYKNYTLIASSEGGGSQGDNGESDVAHSRIIKNKLLNYNYTSGDELFDGSQGQQDASGNPTSAMVVSAINAGRGFINYVGHGSETAFVTSGFGVNNMASLTNNTQFPFVFDVACVNGRFVGMTCFAEAFMRASNANGPAGALAICASTINQSWNEPMAGQDEMVDLLVKSYANNLKYTYGGIVVNGCMFMNDKYPSMGAKMTDTWTIFGDPTIMVRTNTPVALTASHNAVLFLGETQFDVACDMENARATLSVDGELIASAVVIEGQASIILTEPFTEPLMATLTITGYNAIPYVAEVEIIPAEGPYIGIDSYQLEGSVNLTQIMYGQIASIDVAFKNVGIETANNCVATITTENPYVTILQDMVDIGGVDAGQIITKSAAFTVEISDSVPNMTPILFNVSINDDSENIWSGKIRLVGIAPVLEVTNISFVEYHGNGNGRMDAGEIWKVDVITKNKGLAVTQVVDNEFGSTDNYSVIINSVESRDPIEPESTFTTTHTVILNGNIPMGQRIGFIARANSGKYTSNILSASQPVGLILEDFESNGFTSFQWQAPATNSWVIENTAANVFEGSFAMKSAAITHNQSSEITLKYNITRHDSISFYRKVSSESTYDKLYFYINGVQKAVWDGELGWTRFAYAVQPGDSLFNWKYTKDGSVSTGQDKAWIDYIVLPGMGNSASGNIAPVFLTAPETQIIQVAEDTYFEYLIEGYDEDETDTTLVFTCVEKPEWLTFEQIDETNASISGYVTAADTGRVDIVVLQVSDNKTASTQYFFIDTKIYVGVDQPVVSISKMIVYPNPTTDVLNITFESTGAKELLIELYSLDGQKLKTMYNGVSVSGRNDMISNIEGLNSGMYLIRIVLEGQSFVQKLIVK